MGRRPHERDGSKDRREEGEGVVIFVNIRRLSVSPLPRIWVSASGGEQGARERTQRGRTPA